MEGVTPRGAPRRGSGAGVTAPSRPHPFPATRSIRPRRPPPVDAFIACGGNADKSGCVERATLVRIIKVDFGLTIDIEELIDAVDTDGSGEIEYGEFKDLLSVSK